MANFKISNKYKDGIIREDQIFDWFKENNELCMYESKPLDFVNNIIKSVKAYVNFIDGNYISGKKNRQLYEFQKLCGNSFSLHYILLLAAVKLPEHLFDHLIKQMETVIFYYLITKSGTKELENVFSRCADEIREISNIQDKDGQKVKYNAFIKQHFIPLVSSKTEEYANYFNLCGLGSLQKYRIKYILAKISQYVDNHIIGLNYGPKDIDSYLKLEIEHILPNSQKKEVVDDFYKNSSPKTKENQEYEKYKVKLGNLTLLEKPLNIIAGCDVLKHKENEYLNTNVYLTSSIIRLKELKSNGSSIATINKYLRKYDIWNDNNINDRQKKLFELSKEIWRIEEYAD